ncbi:hypothetical protein JHL18_04135 [Clostridium sp. YIM B02505]|uniref:Beta-1,3-glucanase N-terminal domain-containing protein n=1 Tax=Clostridium yunnanense TaxID=2800325 RepID=A0ABS1EKC7_9CLOT|nr:beta-1,3-glucanase family protein [Clostridium yunnanense]MBK1809828.1 hypothetical protein [Clostridium yunnanense]
MSKMKKFLYFILVAVFMGTLLPISSVKAATGVTFYQDANYGGTAVTLGAGSYTMTQLNAAGIPNDWASSLKVPSGWTVEIYQDDNFTGTKWTFTTDTSYVGADCNDKMTSVKITAPGTVSNSIYSVAASSVPAPTGNGAMTFRILNGTNGAYSDSNIYWAIFGTDPLTGKVCYVDLNGNVIPLTSTLNDASGHLTKNNVNYANVFYTVSQKQWVNLPKLYAARMYLSVGSPCYIRTFDNGYTWPDVNNSSDPNRNIYFDFVEFTLDGNGYHGNTTRVDGFGFPIQHRLINKSGSFDRTVGELETETRSGLFTKYSNEVPAAFKESATLQAPYRILPPYRGNNFKSGGAYANYYDSYVNQVWSTYATKNLTFTCWSGTFTGRVIGNDFVFSKNGGPSNIYIHGKPSTYDILAGAGNLVTGTDDEKTVEYQLCAALNRHIVDDPANWNNPSYLYKAAPSNYYSKFWHDHSINGLAYGFCFDDSLAAYLDVNDPKGLVVRVGW